MKTIVLPTIWWLSAAGAAVGVLALGHHIGANSFLTVGVAWLCSIVVALCVGGLAVRIKPDLRFSTRQQTHGHGYVHQHFNIIVYVTLIALVILVISFFK